MNATVAYDGSLLGSIGFVHEHMAARELREYGHLDGAAPLARPAHPSAVFGYAERRFPHDPILTGASISSSAGFVSMKSTICAERYGVRRGRAGRERASGTEVAVARLSPNRHARPAQDFVRGHACHCTEERLLRAARVPPRVSMLLARLAEVGQSAVSCLPSHLSHTGGGSAGLSTFSPGSDELRMALASSDANFAGR